MALKIRDRIFDGLAMSVAFPLLCVCGLLACPLPVTGTPALDIGAPLDSLKTSELHDSFNEIHDGHRHEAIDIMRPRGAPIHAVANGMIRKLFLSRQGGLTIYEFDSAEIYCYYYAHLDHYAAGLREGAPVSRGDIIGYVGTTGNAAPDAPQLHFAIYRLGSDKSWWKGEPINPYPILLQVTAHNKLD
jgi:murein DD-endopeptidase MepM/ murein hydrolase activator NlpD